MKKKGFTLVEIIISISIILIVATATTFFVFNKNKNLKNITQEILEAANAYIKIEKDNKGNIYANEIVRGAKGVKIPLTNLVSSGYIKEELANEIYKSNDELEDNQDYYVMFVEDTANYCDDGSFVAITSWMDKGNNIYLCDNFNGGETNVSLIENILKDYTNIKTLNTITVGDYKITEEYVGYYDDYSFVGRTNAYYSVKESGVFKTNDGTHYFRGNVEDNYVEIAGELFRIISFKENKVRLIKENPIIDEEIYSFDIIFTYNMCGGIMPSSIQNGINNYIKKIFTSYYGHFDQILLPTLPCVGEECNDLYATLLSTEEAKYAGVPLETNDISNNTSNYGVYIAEHWLNNSKNTLLLFDFDNPPIYPNGENCNTNYNGETILIITNHFSAKRYYDATPSNYQYYKNNILSGTFLEFKLLNDNNFTSGYFLNESVRPVITIDNNLIIVAGKGTKNSPYILNLK